MQEQLGANVIVMPFLICPLPLLSFVNNEYLFIDLIFESTHHSLKVARLKKLKYYRKNKCGELGFSKRLVHRACWGIDTLLQLNRVYSWIYRPQVDLLVSRISTIYKKDIFNPNIAANAIYNLKSRLIFSDNSGFIFFLQDLISLQKNDSNSFGGLEHLSYFWNPGMASRLSLSKLILNMHVIGLCPPL